MATQAQISQLMGLILETDPARFFDHMDQTRVGIGAVMRILHQSEGPLTAGMIAEAMDVSTARVAVLLKKMELKGLIVRSCDPLDARVTIIRLSERGEQEDARIREKIAQSVGHVIDEVGMERMLEFVAIARQIGEIFHETPDIK